MKSKRRNGTVLGVALLICTLAMACGGCDDTEGGASWDTTAPSANNADAELNSTSSADVASSGRLDLLLVTDNSGSACGMQAQLRKGFRALIGTLTDAEVDVRLALTTTHMEPDYPLEPVAVPGHIQSTPQPIPGFDRACIEDEQGFGPLREVLDLALACSDVDPSDYQWTDDDIECAWTRSSESCAASKCPDCTIEQLFPPQDRYRALPKVLEVHTYRDATGKFDFAAMEQDFACMALAGTRGHGIEQGLAAAALATSPALVGGAVEAPVDSTAPNHGLIRQDSHFGLLFFSAENDCSHDGTLDVTSCGDMACEFANIEGAEDSPLIDVASFRDELLANLRVAKGGPFDESEMWLGGVIGPSNRYRGPALEASTCSEPSFAGLTPECATPSFVYSGDRYDRFLGQYDGDHVFPPRGLDGRLPGLACETEMSDPLRQLGTWVAAGAR